MGQEKSLPARCNSCHNYSSSTAAPTIIRSPSRSTTATTTNSISLSTTTTLNTTRTHSSATSSASYKSIEKQTKYLNEQLYIKTYLDIVEEDRTAKQQFQPKRIGIRNYTPKILLDQLPSVASSTSSSSIEQDEVDVWI